MVATSRNDGPISTVRAGGVRHLNDGQTLSPIGLGTAPMDDAQSEQAVSDALQAGYRLIDTGAIYGNEVGVGRGLLAGGVARADVQVMTKVRGQDHGYDATLRAFEGSRKRLGLDYVDLYLIHWPLPMRNLYVDTWRALIQLQAEGLVRSIGVSNFTLEHIDRLANETGVLPSVNQIELHPRWTQPELRAGLIERGIQAICYSPLGRGGELLSDPALAAIAEAHDATIAQIVLRWELELGLVPLPRASSPQRRRENFDVFGFSLDADEVTAITTRFQPKRTGWDPNTREEL